MVVAYRTQRLFNFGKSVNFPRIPQIANGRRTICSGGDSHQILRLVGERYRNNLRLCGCRSYHSKEARPTLAKLTPQEVITNSVHGFYKPDCEYAGLSCLDCYSQKQCINLVGLVHWTTTECGSSLTGEANLYCDPNTDECTAVVPDGCAAISRYNCLRDGLLPNLNDCTVYHRCTNMVAEDFVCDTNYVYAQEYGKCVLKLSSDSCVTSPSCSLQDYTALYPGDHSIIYGCITSKSFIKACKETEIHNLNTGNCESRCTSAGNIPNSRNCSSYYQCVVSADNKLGIEEVSCPEGQGYNPSTKKCNSRYLNLCNELHLLETDIYELITFTPVIEVVVQPIRVVLNYFNISPVSVILIFGLDDRILSDGILIIDYIYKNKKLPSTALEIVINVILPYMPSPIQSILKSLMNLGIINVRSGLISINNRQSQEFDDLRNYLISVLSNVTIDIPQMINSIRGKSQEEVSKMVFEEAVKVFKVPESEVPLVALALRTNMPTIADMLNKMVGMALFRPGEGVLRLNQYAVDSLVVKHLNYIAFRMYPHSTFLAGIFQLYAKHKYIVHYGLVRNFVDNFYFTASGLN